jgi:hypothetical protein
VYARTINEQELSFGVSGKLIRNVLVMYDRQTESLWSQLLGEAVSGEMVGAKLEYLPSWQTTWGEWKREYPDTSALKKNFRAFRDPYSSYYQSQSPGVLGEYTIDNRLEVKDLVIGVSFGNQAIAYPLAALQREKVINDSIEGVDLLVVYETQSATSMVYDRLVGDHLLTFSVVEDDPQKIKDIETGSLWNSRTGKALDGPLDGLRLTRLKSTLIFWFGWKDFYQDTLVYGIQ